jgi:hypothetical protein
LRSPTPTTDPLSFSGSARFVNQARPSLSTSTFQGSAPPHGERLSRNVLCLRDWLRRRADYDTSNAGFLTSASRWARPAPFSVWVRAIVTGLPSQPNRCLQPTARHCSAAGERRSEHARAAPTNKPHTADRVERPSTGCNPHTGPHLAPNAPTAPRALPTTARAPNYAGDLRFLGTLFAGLLTAPQTHNPVHDRQEAPVRRSISSVRSAAAALRASFRRRRLNRQRGAGFSVRS